jgi:hypothetical protein
LQSLFFWLHKAVILSSLAHVFFLLRKVYVQTKQSKGITKETENS